MDFFLQDSGHRPRDVWRDNRNVRATAQQQFNFSTSDFAATNHQYVPTLKIKVQR
jgi:hypothetical protein